MLTPPSSMRTYMFFYIHDHPRQKKKHELTVQSSTESKMSHAVLLSASDSSVDSMKHTTFTTISSTVAASSSIPGLLFASRRSNSLRRKAGAAGATSAPEKVFKRSRSQRQNLNLASPQETGLRGSSSMYGEALVSQAGSQEGKNKMGVSCTCEWREFASCGRNVGRASASHM